MKGWLRECADGDVSVLRAEVWRERKFGLRDVGEGLYDYGEKKAGCLSGWMPVCDLLTRRIKEYEVC